MGLEHRCEGDRCGYCQQRIDEAEAERDFPLPMDEPRGWEP